MLNDDGISLTKDFIHARALSRVCGSGAILSVQRRSAEKDSRLSVLLEEVSKTGQKMRVDSQLLPRVAPTGPT